MCFIKNRPWLLKNKLLDLLNPTQPPPKKEVGQKKKIIFSTLFIPCLFIQMYCLCPGRIWKNIHTSLLISNTCIQHKITLKNLSNFRFSSICLLFIYFNSRVNALEGQITKSDYIADVARRPLQAENSCVRYLIAVLRLHYKMC